MNRASAIALLAIVVAVGAVESLMAAWSHRARLSDEDWQALERGLEPEVPALLAQEWLSPSGRMMVAQLAEARAYARPDLRGMATFDVATLAGHGTWSSELQADLEGEPAPSLVSETDAGAFRILRYEQDTGALRASLLDDGASVGNNFARCPERGGVHRCEHGRVRAALAEVDYRPRHCMLVDMEAGVELGLTFGDGDLGDTLRGHVGFHDFNARLRSDAPARVRAFADDTLIGTWVFTDDQGWAPFAAALPEGATHVRLEVMGAARGTWGREGYAPDPAHAICVEARTFEEGRE